MPSYLIKGMNIQSQVFGRLSFLYAEMLSSPVYWNKACQNVAAMVRFYPTLPFEMSIMSTANNYPDPAYPQYQYEKFLSDWGFPSRFPFTYATFEDLPLLERGYIHKDIWTFSNGNVYYVAVYGGSPQTSAIVLYTEKPASRSTAKCIRFNPYGNVNNHEYITIGMYSPQLSTTGFYGLVLRPQSSGEAFSGGNENQPRFHSFLNTYEEAFYKNLPNDMPSGDDPYSPGGTTGPGGGTGTHDPTSSDPILFNILPEVSAVGTGFLSLWSPTEQQMLDLSEYMWNANPLTLDFWRRLIADPIQLIYGLNIIPLSLYDAGLIGGTESVVVGMINTGIKMDYLTSQWVELDCGTIDIEETWGAYLDYDPYTKLDIYLPYIGYKPLRVDDFMPGTIHVKYKIDLLTGACCAQISSTKSDEHGDTLNSVIYQFTGNCATQIPVTATQYADAVRSAISLAAAIGTAALLAGAGAPAAGAAGASIMPGVDPVGLLNPPGMVPVDSELFGTMSQYNFMTAASDTGAALKSAGGTLKNVGMIHAGASAAENVMGIKPSVQRSGAIGGAAGMLGTQTPYLIFTRPRQAVPENQSTYTGYPSFMTRQLSELSGFTQIQAIHLEGIPCTANELAEIDALLKSGVIF